MWFCLVSVKASCIPFQSGDEAKIKYLHVIIHKQTGEPYGGICACTVGLIYILLEEAALSRKKSRKKYLTQVVYFTCVHTLPYDITSVYPNCENLVD